MGDRLEEELEAMRSEAAAYRKRMEGRRDVEEIWSKERKGFKWWSREVEKISDGFNKTATKVRRSIPQHWRNQSLWLRIDENIDYVYALIEQMNEITDKVSRLPDFASRLGENTSLHDDGINFTKQLDKSAYDVYCSFVQINFIQLRELCFELNEKKCASLEPTVLVDLTKNMCELDSHYNIELVIMHRTCDQFVCYSVAAWQAMQLIIEEQRLINRLEDIFDAIINVENFDKQDGCESAKVLLKRIEEIDNKFEDEYNTCLVLDKLVEMELPGLFWLCRTAMVIVLAFTDVVTDVMAAYQYLMYDGTVHTYGWLCALLTLSFALLPTITATATGHTSEVMKHYEEYERTSNLSKCLKPTPSNIRSMQRFGLKLAFPAVDQKIAKPLKRIRRMIFYIVPSAVGLVFEWTCSFQAWMAMDLVNKIMILQMWQKSMAGVPKARRLQLLEGALGSAPQLALQVAILMVTDRPPDTYLKWILISSSALSLTSVLLSWCQRRRDQAGHAAPLVDTAVEAVWHACMVVPRILAIACLASASLVGLLGLLVVHVVVLAYRWEKVTEHPQLSRWADVLVNIMFHQLVTTKSNTDPLYYLFVVENLAAVLLWWLMNVTVVRSAVLCTVIIITAIGYTCRRLVDRYFDDMNRGRWDFDGCKILWSDLRRCLCSQATTQQDDDNP